MFLRALVPAPAARAECPTVTAIERGETFGRTDGHNGPAHTSGSASYPLLEPQKVTISGCRYDIIPADATLLAEYVGHSARCLNFPDQRFGLEIRVTDLATSRDRNPGLTSMKAAP